MDWKTNPLMIAERLIKTISKGEINIDAIDVRGRAYGINMNTLDQALALLHKNKQVVTTTRMGTVWYSLKKVEAPKMPGSHLSWVRNNYPEMTPENDGSGIEADYSFLFMTPEESEKYKANLKGQVFIPKRRVAKAKPVMSAAQLALINMQL